MLQNLSEFLTILCKELEDDDFVTTIILHAREDIIRVLCPGAWPK